jgi:hypothetical protein
MNHQLRGCMKLLFRFLFLSVFIHMASAQAKPHFDLTFNIGPSLGQDGNITDLGDPSLSTGFGVNYFFKRNHGIGFSYNNESTFEGSNRFPDIENGSISTFDLHYAYRYIVKNLHIVFEPGIGRQTLYDASTDPYWGYFYSDDLSTAFILNYKLFFRYVITQFEDGDIESGYLFAGAGVIHNFSFDDNLQGSDISGNRLALLFQLGLGW